MAPILLELTPRFVVELALILAQRLGIHAALPANPAVAQKHLFA